MLRNQSAALAISLAVAAAPAAAPKFAVNRTRRAGAPTIVRVTTPDDGFDWRDAGIGAAGGFALSMIGMGGALVVSARRSPHLGQHDRPASPAQPSTSKHWRRR
jgi:hypothetical protein